MLIPILYYHHNN